MLIDAAKASLLIVDMQQRLVPAMTGGEAVVKQCAVLLKAALALGVPVAVSEQYPKGLGHTLEALRTDVGGAPVFEKLNFSCWRDVALRAALINLHDSGRPQVIIAGIEAHVCVLQSALDLAQAGFAVFVVADATASRTDASKTLALSRMEQAGVCVINTEMAIFELLGKAGTAEFKQLSSLIK